MATTLAPTHSVPRTHAVVRRRPAASSSTNAAKSTPSATTRTQRRRRAARVASGGDASATAHPHTATPSGLLLPPYPPPHIVDAGLASVRAARGGNGGSSGGGAAEEASSGGSSYSDHKPKSPPPDLPSLLLDARIVYVGMPLVPSVTELLIAELLYLQYLDRFKPIYMYINSTGCSRADGETVSAESESYAIYDTMQYVKNPVHTIGVGVAVGQAAMLLAAGDRGKRYMLPHATCMLQQPNFPGRGSQQASDIELEWKEVLTNKKTSLELMSHCTQQPVEKLEADMYRPYYMTAPRAVAYGIADSILDPDKDDILDKVKSAKDWDAAAGFSQKAK